jgi:hypothetical protein
MLLVYPKINKSNNNNQQVSFRFTIFLVKNENIDQRIPAREFELRIIKSVHYDWRIFCHRLKQYFKIVLIRPVAMNSKLKLKGCYITSLNKR